MSHSIKMMPLFNRFFPANIIAFTSDRTVDFTLGNDQRILNTAQKEFLCSQLNLALSEPVHICQVHGDKITIAGEPSCDECSLEEADGLITRVLDLPLAIRSADCLPVFLYDEKQNGIGLIHIGWKGSQKNIAEQAIKLMCKEWRTDPGNIKVAFGPSIHSCCYEVGNEFQDLFPGDIITRNNQNYIDLPQLTRDQLLACGVGEVNIFDCDICTYCDPNYFSFRREGGRAGRMISLMMIKKAGD